MIFAGLLNFLQIINIILSIWGPDTSCCSALLRIALEFLED